VRTEFNGFAQRPGRPVPEICHLGYLLDFLVVIKLGLVRFPFIHEGRRIAAPHIFMVKGINNSIMSWHHLWHWHSIVVILSILFTTIIAALKDVLKEGTVRFLFDPLLSQWKFWIQIYPNDSLAERQIGVRISQNGRYLS
jgi:hypothetical protein